MELVRWGTRVNKCHILVSYKHLWSDYSGRNIPKKWENTLKNS